MKKTIFYHDTDCGNVVYYANYLKYFEEARTLFMAQKGFSVPALMQRGLYFVYRASLHSKKQMSATAIIQYYRLDV